MDSDSRPDGRGGDVGGASEQEQVPSAPDTRAGGDGPALSARTRVLLGLIALAVAAIAVMSIAGGDSSKSGPAGTNQAEGAATPTGKPGAIDMFDRADGDLGVSGSGDTWTMQNGEWGIADQGAIVVDKAADRRTTATVDTASPNGSLDVVLDAVRPQCGVVFRMRSPVDYLALLAVPDLGTWNLLRIGMAGPVAIGNLGQAPVKDGTRVHIELSGADVTVAVGNVRRQFVVPDLVGGTKAGLVCGGPLESAQGARFSEFVYLPAASNPNGSTSSPGAAVAPPSSSGAAVAPPSSSASVAASVAP